ncbi:MAG: UDP-N-acetylglucosamine 2-epimerase (non-hydrolyzing) [Candidatus Micrarchaeota archaeon]
MKIIHAFGTRACAIKMAPLVRESVKRGHKTLIIWSGQHYSPNLYEEVFDDLEMPRPTYDIEARGSTCEMGSTMLKRTEKICYEEKPDVVLTHGDTFSALFISLAASMSLSSVGHVEAGLRTGSWEPFPEQICTRGADACSALYFAPTEQNKKNLLSEGYPKDRIFVVGNTIVDGALQHSKMAMEKSKILDELKIDKSKPLVFWSCHRKENMIKKERMIGIFESLLAMKDYTIFCSVLPSTQQAASKYGYSRTLAGAKHILWSPCLPKYTDAMRILLASSVCLTDSGGLQEECACLSVPCLTLRYVTDRPESVEAGANKCVGTEKDNIMKETGNVINNKSVSKKMRDAKNPYGDGKTAPRIMDILEKFNGKMERWEKAL